MICFTLRFVRNLYFFMVSKHSRIKLIFTLFYILQTLKTQKYILHFLIIRSMKILVYVLLISNVTWKENLSQKKFQKVPPKKFEKVIWRCFCFAFLNLWEVLTINSTIEGFSCIIFMRNHCFSIAYYIK